MRNGLIAGLWILIGIWNLLGVILNGIAHDWVLCFVNILGTLLATIFVIKRLKI
jgi:hypothetical protein